MQNKSTSSGCNGAKQGSNCVIWTGSDIPALGIVKGESVTDIVCTIATQLVGLTTPLDLSTVSIQCLKDQLNINEPVERTIATLLQIAFDSSCDLKTLIDGINAKLTNSTPSLVLDLKCLGSTDIYGNPLPYNEQSVLQGLINTVCGLSTTVTSLSGNLTNLQNQVNALPAPYTEPTLSSCLFNSRKSSDAIVITASALCSYQGQVGQVTDIQSAIAKVPTAFGTTYGLLPGWIVNPTNLAQLTSNLLMVISDQFNQLNTINNTCCKGNCDSILVDFDIKLSDDRTQATLFFATKSNVPAGWTETNPLGSKLTVTDSNGNIFTKYIKVISQLTNPDGIVVDLSASAIDPSLDYTFGMNVTLTNGTLTCVKCIGHTATFKDTCAFCQIAVTGSKNGTSRVVIIYTDMNGNVQFNSIPAGQTQVIPKTSKVTSVILYGSPAYTSTCTLPSPTNTSCYELSWSFSKSSGGASAVFTDTKFIYLTVMGQNYPISCGSQDYTCFQTAFAALPPVQLGLMANPRYINSQSAQRFDHKLYFQTTADIAATMQGFMGDPANPNGASDGFDSGAYFKPVSSDPSNCPALSGGTGA